jgi:four helix bundle protein
MARYESLKVWQVAHGLNQAIRRLVQKFPREERFELSAQLRRAATSVPCNLVEGSGLVGSRGFLRHVRIATASLREVEYLVLLSREDEYITTEQWSALQGDIRHVRILLHRLAKSLERAPR